MTKKTNYLYEAAKFYEKNLQNKHFKIYIKRKSQLQEIVLYFDPSHFYHLFGLHKLSDLPNLKRSNTNIYNEILSNKITYEQIQKSQHFSLIESRILNYKELLNILDAKSVYFKSLHGTFKGIHAECVITKNMIDNNFSFLFMKKSTEDYIPCSFFIRDEMKEYTKEGTRWTITKIEQL